MSILKNEIKRLQERVAEIEKEEEQARVNKCANDISWNFANLKRLNKDVSERRSDVQKQKHEKDMRMYNQNGMRYETIELWQEATESMHRRRLKHDFKHDHMREWRIYWCEWCISHDIQPEDMPDCGPQAIKIKEHMEEALDTWFNEKNDTDTFKGHSHVHHVMARMDELVVSTHNLFGILMARIKTLEGQVSSFKSH